MELILKSEDKGSLRLCFTQKEYRKVINRGDCRHNYPSPKEPWKIMSHKDVKNPKVLTFLLRCYRPFALGHWKVEFLDGYVLYPLEYVAEQGLSCCQKILAELLIPDYQGDLLTALDFLYLLNYCGTNVPLWDNTGLDYSQVLERGRKLMGTQKTSNPVSESALLLWAAREIPPSAGVEWYYLDRDWSPLDKARYPFYLGERSRYLSIPHNLIKGAGQVPSKFDRFSVGYQRPPLPKDQRKVLRELEKVVIPPLAGIVGEYLFKSLLEVWAQEIGMVFPPSVEKESERYCYYWENLREYIAILWKRDMISVGEVQKDSTLWSDSELLVMGPEVRTWTSRKDLERRVLG